MNTAAKNSIIISPLIAVRNSGKLKALRRLAGSLPLKQAKKWLVEVKKMRKEW